MLWQEYLRDITTKNYTKVIQHRNIFAFVVCNLDLFNMDMKLWIKLLFDTLKFHWPFPSSWLPVCLWYHSSDRLPANLGKLIHGLTSLKTPVSTSLALGCLSSIQKPKYYLDLIGIV